MACSASKLWSKHASVFVSDCYGDVSMFQGGS